MEKYCVSLEIAKKLVEAEWKKETEFWWQEYNIDKSVYLLSFTQCKGFVPKDSVSKYYPAPLSDEILKNLINIQGFVMPYYSPSEKDWIENRGGNRIHSNTLPNALAKMWIFLKSNNLLEGRKG